jgi:hypothetical protein
VNAERPGVSERLDRFSLTGQISVFISNFCLPDHGLEIGSELDAIWGIDIDHLNLAGQCLTARQRAHNLQTVTQNEPIRPLHVMPVKLYRLRVRLLWIGK